MFKKVVKATLGSVAKHVVGSRHFDLDNWKEWEQLDLALKLMTKNARFNVFHWSEQSGQIIQRNFELSDTIIGEDVVVLAERSLADGLSIELYCKYGAAKTLPTPTENFCQQHGIERNFRSNNYPTMMAIIGHGDRIRKGQPIDNLGADNWVYYLQYWFDHGISGLGKDIRQFVR